jgi:hypothetical protein
VSGEKAVVFEPRQHRFHLDLATKEQSGFFLLKGPQTRVR